MLPHAALSAPVARAENVGNAYDTGARQHSCVVHGHTLGGVVKVADVNVAYITGQFGKFKQGALVL